MSTESKRNEEKNRFQFLLDQISELGATEAKIIPSKKILHPPLPFPSSLLMAGERGIRVSFLDLTLPFLLR